VKSTSTNSVKLLVVSPDLGCGRGVDRKARVREGV
jgi:hypothetical protein